MLIILPLPFQANSKTVLCGSILFVSRQTIVFGSMKEILANPFSIFQTADKIIHSIGMRK
jgi:hypothetical protein